MTNIYHECIITNFREWLAVKEAGAAVPYVGQSAGCCGSWQGAPSGKPEPLSSVGPVKTSSHKSKKKGKKKKKKK